MHEPRPVADSETNERRDLRTRLPGVWTQAKRDRFLAHRRDAAGAYPSKADTAVPHDMTYYGLPPFYPPGWFWIGGRFAALTGTPGWEMFKPWAITSIAIAVVLAFVLWASMIRFEYALIVSTATAAAALAYSSTEPYAAIITVLLPPVFVLAWSGLRGATRSGGWAAIIGVGVFLGVAALFYALLFG